MKRKFDAGVRPRHFDAGSFVLRKLAVADPKSAVALALYDITRSLRHSTMKRGYFGTQSYNEVASALKPI
ncbi:hypothetical protein Taro_048870 [Colocasia esculenta]|uniref:Uncharacterized protein n=1 Tax=Colocasia esculenta TaxID=4460 RepID=A0A843X9H0_COLES|nr:hypothetical protein [Colocasia esculenta]